MIRSSYCAAAIGELAGSRQLVVAVDDAQLLDPVSAVLVLHVVRATAGFVLATVRSGRSLSSSARRFVLEIIERRPSSAC